MFKKRNFRRKVPVEGDFDEEGEESMVPSSAPSGAIEKITKRKSKKAGSSNSLSVPLSFEEEEEEDGPALMLSKASSKDSLSLKDTPVVSGKSQFKSKKDREKQKEVDKNSGRPKDHDKGSTQRPQAGSYTLEMLAQLRSETKTIRSGSTSSTFATWLIMLLCLRHVDSPLRMPVR
jgi:hypothetical protein